MKGNKMADRRNFLKGLFFSAAGVSVISLPSDITGKIPSEIIGTHGISASIKDATPEDETVKMVFEALWKVLDGRASTPLELKIRDLVAKEIPPIGSVKHTVYFE